jgi:hypothetical protein
VASTVSRRGNVLTEPSPSNDRVHTDPQTLHCYDSDSIANSVSSNPYIVACVFVASGTSIPGNDKGIHINTQTVVRNL